jgi:hypothetical protein
MRKRKSEMGKKIIIRNKKSKKREAPHILISSNGTM